jgi:hypothetical protein
MSAPPVLVYLYGPPASGKLTIAQHVRDLTGIRLFHNHLTVNAVREVFDFGTPPFMEVLHRVRLDIFATAMRAGTSLIFTNNSALGGADGRARFEAFATAAASLVEGAGGRTVFVHVTAPLAVLEARVGNESRRAHGKLVEAERLRQLVAGLDDSALHPGDVEIDTADLAPIDAAHAVARAVAR